MTATEGDLMDVYDSDDGLFQLTVDEIRGIAATYDRPTAEEWWVRIGSYRRVMAAPEEVSVP